MQKKLILGVVLALTLTLTSPVVAAGEKPFQLPSFDVVEWVFGLLEVFELESSSEAMEPKSDLNGLDSELPISEIGAAPDPGGEHEMEPGYEPNGESTEEMGPIADPMG